MEEDEKRRNSSRCSTIWSKLNALSGGSMTAMELLLTSYAGVAPIMLSPSTRVSGTAGYSNRENQAEKHKENADQITHVLHHGRRPERRHEFSALQP